VFRRVIPLILVLAFLSIGVPRANAQTPTPTATITPVPRLGFYWTGELLTSPVVFTSTANIIIAASTCPAGWVAGIMSITSSDNAIYLHRQTISTGATPYVFWDRYTTTTPSTVVHITYNSYYPIPFELQNLAVTTLSSNTAITEIYTDFGSPPVPGGITGSIDGYIINGTSAKLMSFSLLCYVPPSATATPADVSRVSLTSGSQLRLDRSVSYGDIAVVTAILGLMLFVLFYFLIRIPKLWN
jgi:hypothetical protein